MSKCAVVLFNLGGPDAPAAVRPFLFNLFNDPAIIGFPRGAGLMYRSYFVETGVTALGLDTTVPPGIARVRAYFAEAAGAAAKFLAAPEGPRVGALAFDGWDTHVQEGAVTGRLADLLGALDGAIGAIKTNMGEAWNETVVTLVTEFGRTARINGNAGTDHGTATVALLLGGALKGGRVIADWPGVKETDLYEKRDLKATTDLRAVLKGLLRDHLRADERALAADVFPGSDAVAPMTGLLA